MGGNSKSGRVPFISHTCHVRKGQPRVGYSHKPPLWLNIVLQTFCELDEIEPKKFMC